MAVRALVNAIPEKRCENCTLWSRFRKDRLLLGMCGAGVGATDRYETCDKHVLDELEALL